MKKIISAAALGLPILLSGCGGGSGTSSSTGSLTLGLTDAPIDEAKSVFIEFSGLSLKQGTSETSDEWINIDFNQPISIDLLTLQGSSHINLLSEEQLPVGAYSEIRLHIHQDDTDNDEENYIVLNDGSDTTHPITIPSGLTSGLKVKGDINIPENGEAGFTIDFDVRKSIVVQGNGEYKLKPVLKLTEDSLTGHIAGSVSSELLVSSDGNWSCSDEDVSTYNAVYIFNGANTTPVDTSEGSSEPLTTALVNYDDTTGKYSFEAGYLLAGDYTVSFTCHTDHETFTDIKDDQDNIIETTANNGDDLQFIGTQTVTVIAGETSSVEITAPIITP